MEAPLAQTPFERASDKIKHLGGDAQLTLDEAAAIVDVSVSTFERLAVPYTQWAGRTRRWRYAAICARARELELLTLQIGG